MEDIKFIVTRLVGPEDGSPGDAQCPSLDFLQIIPYLSGTVEDPDCRQLLLQVVNKRSLKGNGFGQGWADAKILDSVMPRVHIDPNPNE